MDFCAVVRTNPIPPGETSTWLLMRKVYALPMTSR